MPDIVLASASVTRSDLLNGAGVEHRVQPARVDEDAVKAALLSDGIGPRDLADALAEMKALKISARDPGALVIGADQTLDLDGTLFDKPKDMTEAREHLRQFSGKTHRLHAAVVIAEGGQPVFRKIGTVRMTMRPLTADFIDAYLDQAGEAVLSSVGAYQLESLGGQLFSAVEGDYFSVLGLPLLEVLGYLRIRGHLPS